MIRITRTGELCSGSANDLASLCALFEHQHCLHLPGFLDVRFLELLNRKIQAADFRQRTIKDIGTEFYLPADDSSGLLHFLVNNTNLFRIIQQIAQCRPISFFQGRIFRVRNGIGWHNDNKFGRMIALSINLSTEAFSGGLLQLRDVRSKQIVHEVANTEFGDAVIVRIADYLEHRVTPFTSLNPRTAFAGWFLPYPDITSFYQTCPRRSLLTQFG